ncbi:MAG: lipid-A-disaccharide synthase [Lentisphaeria bacterium]|nr:lipid-A-disaccharide synthase [Lentisphaeria bacterium]
MSETVWIIAGETSGDGYGARLAAELWRKRPELVVRGMGGPAMAKAGVDIMIDSSELGVVGLVEVFRHIFTFIRIFQQLVRRASKERPDVVVLIDYPGFNLRFAKRLHALGIRVVWYISPQVWAWKRGRIHKLAAYVDKMLAIFPFEPEVYAEVDLDVSFIGHPLLEELEEGRDPELVRDPDTVLLLPGSRRMELARLLPDLVRTAAILKQKHPSLTFVMPLPRPTTRDLALKMLDELRGTEKLPDIQVEVGTTRMWMQRAGTGLAATGTVTVEAAILGVPLVTVYRVNWLVAKLARLIVRLDYATMVNIIGGREIFPERVQEDMTVPKLVEAMESILPGGARREETLTGMRETVATLGGNVPASARVAQCVLEQIDRSE